MENMPLAINITIVGLAVVFLALVILSIIISLFSRAMYKVQKLGDGKNKGDGGISEYCAAVDEKAEGKIDGEVVAAIMAAIYAMGKTMGTHLKVSSIKRLGKTAPAWNNAGKMERMENKL
jgi:sodium pump decarboxylase gamma subunit